MDSPSRRVAATPRRRRRGRFGRDRRAPQVALDDDDTLQSLQSDPSMKADAIAHLAALQDQISTVMKTLQTA